jgi:ferrous iron transport protein B
MTCHTTPAMPTNNPALGSIALVGHPNVGKSALFQCLTGLHVTISNYPGTTVEVSRGRARALPATEFVDTPGIITFPPYSEDEQVTARFLLDEPVLAVLQVGDAKNLHRTLLLTIQLIEMGLPMVLALNMTDEAASRGIQVDVQALSEALSIAVIPTTATRGKGIAELNAALSHAYSSRLALAYPPVVEKAAETIMACFSNPPLAPRAMALLFLSGDSVIENWIREKQGAQTIQELSALRLALQENFVEPLAVIIQQVHQDKVEQIVSRVVQEQGTTGQSFSTRLGYLTTQPVWGLVILAGVLYALYWFVGVFGAGMLVGLLEGKLFGQILNPLLITWAEKNIPFPLLVELFFGPYGLWTMGMTYALALILPIVTTFFLAFGIMEDSGYLPRLAALSNRLFEKIGLNGKAVLPIVLGLGCVTMATLTTRVMESKRERFLVTLLLALAVPCSAQLGIVMGMLAGISLGAVMIWGGVVMLVLATVGWLAARLVSGERTPLLVELPPLRLPQVSNVLLKTLARLEWYIKEVVPLFLAGTALMFILSKTGLLQWLEKAGEPLVTGWLGLPAQTSAAFLMGFLRRDFGATGLFAMQSQGLLSPVQVVVAMVTITLFIPCIASVLMIAKERGWRTALGMFVLIIPLALLVGGVLNQVLSLLKWGA